jgi:hypothetical protein
LLARRAWDALEVRNRAESGRLGWSERDPVRIRTPVF